ncbi:hypothetical protein F5884DRAFT_659507 [Xylogone sp. PMI_703]|nr:hypothetical protein F5884DRAFT_659507 [Xylogone sp. PMI_703]
MADTEHSDKGGIECPEELVAGAEAAGAKAEGSSSTEKKEEVEEALPKLSAAEFAMYNRMSENMEYFHNHYRHSWNLVYKSCVNNARPANLSLRQFINTGLQFVSSLSMHHAIEEQHVFPMLARKMPEFQAGKNRAELLRQHDAIHKGMDGFEEYLMKCMRRETELDLGVLKEQMDTWGEVLWKHLDQEVKTLGAENMRKYWTLEEMRRMPI